MHIFMDIIIWLLGLIVILFVFGFPLFVAVQFGSLKQKTKKLEEESKKLDDEIARIDSFTRSIKGATNRDYIKEQQKRHFPDKFK